MGHQPSLERYSKTCYFSRQVSFVSKNPLHLGMGSMSKDRPPYHLSGGEQKKVALAAILALNPDVLMIDEPLNGLDNKTRQWFKEFLMDFIKSNKTILISTHEQELLSLPHSRIIKFNDEHTILN